MFGFMRARRSRPATIRDRAAKRWRAPRSTSPERQPSPQPLSRSEGATEEEALANISEAIVEYLSVVEEQLKQAETREIEVAV
jgi:hypothetical protein